MCRGHCIIISQRWPRFSIACCIEVRSEFSKRAYCVQYYGGAVCSCNLHNRQTTCRSFNSIDASDWRKWCTVGMNAMRLDKRYPDSDRAKGMRKWISSSYPSTLHISKVNFRNNRSRPPLKKRGGLKETERGKRQLKTFRIQSLSAMGFLFISYFVSV